MIVSLDERRDEAFERVVQALSGGGVVALPTDTVYGLVALPGDERAMRRVFELKARADTKSVAVLASDIEQIRALTPAPLDRFERWWPGPLTVVVPRRAAVALHLGGDALTVGVRCPDHRFVRDLANRLGPLAATSANRSGDATLARAADVAAAFPELEVVVDGGTLAAAASTVVDATVDPPVVRREGPIAAASLGLEHAGD